MKIIAITGQIGVGKSVVSQVLRVMGYPVYDCDSQAQCLMVTHPQLVAGITQLLGKEAYHDDGSLNRTYVASRIFAHSHLVAQMNALVHPVVIADIRQWATHTGSEINFVETALLRESNMITTLSDVWTVTAPCQLCIDRVMRRSNLTHQQVSARLEAQSNELIENARIIVNDNINPIIPQIVEALLDYGCALT